MKAKIILSLAFTMIIALMNAMDYRENIMDDGETIEVIIEAVGTDDPLKSGDRVYLTRVMPQDNRPPLSTGCKVFTWLGTAGLCLITLPAAGLAEYGTIQYVNEHDGSDQNGAVLMGTAVGLGVCTLGMCIYACSAAMLGAYKHWNTNKQAKREITIIAGQNEYDRV